MKEIFTPIKGYEDCYEVSNTGIVRSINRRFEDNRGSIQFKKSTILKGYLDRGGYKKVHLCKNGFSKNYMIHRLVAVQFIENPENKRTVNHIDGNKLNNCISNLEWNIHSENNKHALLNNLREKGEKHYNSKLSNIEILEIREKFKSGIYLQKEIAKLYNTTPQNICFILNNKTRI